MLTFNEARQRLSLYGIRLYRTADQFVIALQDQPKLKPTICPSLEDAVIMGANLRRLYPSYAY